MSVLFITIAAFAFGVAVGITLGSVSVILEIIKSNKYND